MNKQKDLYPVQEAQSQKTELAHPSVLRACKNGVEALRHTALQSDLADEELATSIGKAKRVLSRALNGRAGLPIDTYIRLMRQCNSVFLLEYMCREMGGRFVWDTSEEREIREMEERLAEMKARRAA
jgi:hypothetical protein